MGQPAEELGKNGGMDLGGIISCTESLKVP